MASPASPVALVPCTEKLSESPTRVGNWSKGTVALCTAPAVPGTLTTGGLPTNWEPLPQLDPVTVQLAAGRLLSHAFPWHTVQLTVQPVPPLATVVTDSGTSQGPTGSWSPAGATAGVDYTAVDEGGGADAYVVLGRSPGTVNWVCPFTGNWVVAGVGPPPTTAAVCHQIGRQFAVLVVKEGVGPRQRHRVGSRHRLVEHGTRGVWEMVLHRSWVSTG